MPRRPTEPSSGRHKMGLRQSECKGNLMTFTGSIVTKCKPNSFHFPGHHPPPPSTCNLPHRSVANCISPGRNGNPFPGCGHGTPGEPRLAGAASGWRSAPRATAVERPDQGARTDFVPNLPSRPGLHPSLPFKPPPRSQSSPLAIFPASSPRHSTPTLLPSQCLTSLPPVCALTFYSS